MGASDQTARKANDSAPPPIAGVTMWLRRRAERQTAWAKAIAPLRLKGLPHEEVRTRLGLTVNEYRRARRWLDDAVQEAVDSIGPLSVEEALAVHAERQVELVLRFGMLRRQELAREQICTRLGLSDDGYRLTLEWWRDACSATLAARRQV